MSKVCVVTGGGSGMGLEAAKLVGQNGYKVVLMGRTVSKLEDAVKTLKDAGVDAEAYPGDASDRESVKELADHAASLGQVKVLIHAAGVSPHMTNAEKIFEINAGGTVIINEEFAKVMTDGGCILNVASMAAYMLPADRRPVPLYKASLQDLGAFLGGFKQMLTHVPEEQHTGTAYTVSKDFVRWYSKRMAVKHGKSGLRVVSISPGTFATPMGEIEGEQASSIAENGALARVGDPLEIAKMMAFIVSDDCSYLTGTDILYDGGSIAAIEVKGDQAQ